MTNRDLAERIARDVLEAVGPLSCWGDEADVAVETAACAVLDVLHETGTGFCCYDVDEAGATLFKAMDDDAERMEQDAKRRVKENQQELFGDGA